MRLLCWCEGGELACSGPVAERQLSAARASKRTIEEPCSRMAASDPLADIADEVQFASMSIPSILLAVIALSWSPLPFQAPQDESASYGASVTFRDGECWFWTGDVGLTARQFRSDLADRFDRKRGIVISFPEDTPARCVELARRSATRAGFKMVKVAVRADAGPIGPPLNGS